jgi:hypothetical protein
MSIRIRKLDDGYLVTDSRGPQVWEGAAVSKADAEVMAENRLAPRLPAPPPGRNGVTDHGGYAEAQPPHPLAAAQFDQATGDASCVGGVCTMD